MAIGDINNDGLQDIYFTGNQVENKLYLNKGDLKFEDITEKAGVNGSGQWNTGVSMADVNGDGWLDIYVCVSGGATASISKISNQLYLNNGDLSFTEAAADFGLEDKSRTNHAVFFDYDNDNDLDLYLLNHPLGFGILLLKDWRNPKELMILKQISYTKTTAMAPLPK